MELNDIVSDMNSLRGSRHTRQWQPFMEKYHCDVICEIGVQNGYNFMEMIKHQPKLAVAVDSWIADGVTAHNDGLFPQEVLNDQYLRFKNEMADKPFVNIYRGYSFDVVKIFPDNYFDFVYIDADHTYEGCKRDINDWYPKVKIGGFLCGHDYIRRNYRVNFGVIEAVDEFVKNNNISTFFKVPHSIWGISKI